MVNESAFTRPASLMLISADEHIINDTEISGFIL